MAEFLTLDEGKSHFGSKGTANAGLTLGIIGTALAALNSGVLGRGGILGGLGNSGSGNALAGGIIGAELANGSTGAMSLKEINDQDFDLWEMGKIREEGLRNAWAMREKDIAEKIEMYRQTKEDNNNIENKLGDLKDYTVSRIHDESMTSFAEDQKLAKQISDNRFESYKNVSDLYTTTVQANKDLELQIEKNRETDQNERFQIYKDLSDKNSALAYATMKQSYEDRLEAMNNINSLASRVCALEKDQAVTSAQLPLMFKLSESNTANAISTATSNKVDGNLTIAPYQISTPFVPFNINSAPNPCGL